MARKKNAPTPTTRIVTGYDDRRYAAAPAAWESDDEAEIRFSLTALGEAVVSGRERRPAKFRGFGPCGRIVA